MQIEIFALRPPAEAILHDSNERVRAPVYYLPYRTHRRICDWWRTVRMASAASRRVSDLLEAAVLAAPCVIGSDGDRDGLPTVLLEAMALGTPCVSTDVTGIPEAIRDGDTGLLVPKHDAVAPAEALQRLLASDSLRARLATAARSSIEAEFDTRLNAARMRPVFQECARAAAAAARAAA